MANISFALGVDVGGSGSATTSVMSSVTTSAGERVLVGIRYASTSVNISSVSDGTNTYNLVGAVRTGSADRQAWYEAINVAGGTVTITVTYASAVTGRYAVSIRCSNSDSSASQAVLMNDTGGASSWTTTANNISTGNMTPTSQPAGILGIFQDIFASAVITNGTGMTSLGSLTNWDAVAGDQSLVNYKRVTSTSADDATAQLSSGTDGGYTWGIVVGEAASSTTDQQGFAFGDDDGNEASHTLGTEDTNYSGALGTKTLRAQIDTTLDVASTAFKLKFQKNGAGGYSDVKTSSTSVISPTPTSSDATESGNDTASSSWTTFAVPNASTGDLLIFCLSWDDSTATTGVTAPSGQNGETLTAVNSTPATDASTETRSKVWYCKCTGAWTAGNITFTPSASEQWTGACIRIPAGQFDATTPVGASATNAATGTAEANIQHAAFSAGSSDGNGRLFVWTSADADPQTVASGFTQVCNTDRGAESGGLFTRNTLVSNSESFSATTVATITSDSWTSVAFVVRSTTVTNEVYISTSSNVTAGGEATTARLTAPSGKSGNFTTGRRWDDENGTDSIDITSDYYTELEWVLTTQSPAATSDYYDFRVYAGDVALTTYSVTPRWTISGGVTVALSGQALTASAGTLIPTKDVALTGNLLTASAGTLIPAPSVVLSGQQGALSAGTLAPSASVALSGSALAGSAGTLTPSLSLALSGQQGALSAGAIVPEISIALTGIQATFSQGTLTPVGGDAGDVTVALSGQALTLATGTLLPSTTLALSGSAIAASAGTLVPATDKALSGSQITAATGTLTPAVSVPLTGVSGTFSSGTVTAQVGNDVTIALTGVSLSLGQGIIGFLTDASDQTQNSGGWVSYFALEQQALRRRRLRAEAERLAEEAEERAAEDAQQAEIARLLHIQLAKDQEREEIDRLRNLVVITKELTGAPDHVKNAFEKAKAEQTFSRLQALQRELIALQEAEEMALLMVMLGDD